jgi:cellulose synthase/poly-beta-1,6-N-acetylglucosamine synthase-like glycosyltransferase
MDSLRVYALPVFCACAALVFYTYAGYPAIVWVLARLVGRRGNAAEVADAELPTVSLLVAAYNEETVIQQRILNALSMDYPKDKLEIVVATDGCSDGTAEIVRRYARDGIRLLECPHRRGKATALNDSIPQLKGEIVILSDANTFTKPSAARNLARWFVDPDVGSVCGRLILTDPNTGGNVDGMYWKYETFLKKCEGKLGALLGANGGLYAIRRSTFAPIPADTIVDDFVIPLEARLRCGCRIVYDPTAVAWEEIPNHIGAEFRRRARIGAGGAQSFSRLWRLLDPRQGWVAFTFVSHKVLRWVCPFLLIGLALSNIALANEQFFFVSLSAQAAFYAVSGLLAIVPIRAKALKPLMLTTMFTGMNLALLFGFGRWLAGTQTGIWVRTARSERSDSVTPDSLVDGNTYMPVPANDFG